MAKKIFSLLMILALVLSMQSMPLTAKADPGTLKNVALNQPVEVSSNYTGEARFSNDYLTDGDWTDSSRLGWATNLSEKIGANDPADITITMNKIYLVSQVVVKPAKADAKPLCPRDYEIQVSTDKTNWTTVATATGKSVTATNDADVEPFIHDITPTHCKYVRVHITGYNFYNAGLGTHVASLGEIEAMGYFDESIYTGGKEMELYINNTLIPDFSLEKQEYNVSDTQNTQPVITLADKDGKLIPIEVEYVDNKASFSISGKEYTVNYKVADKFANEIKLSEYPFIHDKKFKDSEVGVNTNWYKKRELAIRNRSFESGLSFHAGHEISIELVGAMKRFVGLVGMDATAAVEAGQKAVMKIEVDGKSAFEKTLSYEDVTSIYPIDIDLTGKQTMKISVTGECADAVTVSLANAKFDSNFKEVKDVIKVDGETFEKFDKEKYNYEYVVPKGTTVVPEVRVVFEAKDCENKDYEINCPIVVSQAEKIPGYATFTFEEEAYKVRIVQRGQEKITITSDNPLLDEYFNWATYKTDQFVMTGKTGPIDKYEGHPATSNGKYIPSYWAGYYDRTAFYGRDFVHQASGAQIAGLSDENYSMFNTFAKNCTEARKYYTLWAFNFDGSPITCDYQGDNWFVREVPAQFELVEKAYDSYIWTADERYISDEMMKYYKNVMENFVSLHDSNGNEVAEGTGQSIFMGSATYNERGENPIEAGDAIACQYAATVAYSKLLAAKGETAESEKWKEKADNLKKYFNEDWSIDPNNPNGNYVYGLKSNGTKLTGFGKETSWFMPMKLITEPGERNDNYLDYIYEQVNGSGRPSNIEAITYIPDVLFPYNRSDQAWEIMKQIMSIKDRTHEKASQGTNGDYPEVSFTFISHVVEGMMGIEPDAVNNTVYTISRLPSEVTTAQIDFTRVGNHQISVRHEGSTSTSLSNDDSGEILWQPRFYGKHNFIRVNGRNILAKADTLNGIDISYVDVSVKSGEEVTAEVSNVGEIKMIEGMEQTVEKGNTAKFVSNAEFNDFNSVSVDGAEISADSYTANEGSTIILLKSDYTKTLGLGEHEISINSTTGSPKTTFTVVDSLESKKDEAIKELEEYRKTKDDADYRPEQVEELNKALEEGKKAIKAATTPEEVQEALEATKAAMDAVKTDAQLAGENEDGETPAKPGDGETPAKPDEGGKTDSGGALTGDDSNSMIWIICAGFSAMALIYMTAAKGKKQRQ